MKEKKYKIPKVKIAMVQEGVINSNIDKITCTEDLAEFVANEIGDSDREIVGVITVNLDGQILNWNTVSIGSIETVSCEVRDVFKTCFLSNARGLFVFHCHPSGNATPSEEDFCITKKLVEAGKLLDFPVIDSVIVGCGTYEFCTIRGLKPELFGDNPEETESKIVWK